MKYSNGARPIGLNTLCHEVERTCSEAYLFQRCGLRPKHLILPLDSGSGRTTFLEYMAQRYKDAGVLPFTSGLDDYIEITLDGTLPQLKQAFAAIAAASVYTNEYCNLIGMDISSIASHLGEIQFTEFLKNCKRVCAHACVIFFVHASPTRNEEKLLEKLCETIGNIKRLSVEPYSKDDLCALILQSLKEHGIQINQEPAFHTVLSTLVSQWQLSDLNEALHAAEVLMHRADFSGFVPVLDETMLQTLLVPKHPADGRRDVK